MRDFISFLIFIAICWGLIAAIPIVAVVVGVGLGMWILWEAWREHNAQKRP